MAYSLVSDSIVTTSGTVFVVSDRAGNVRADTLEGLYAQDTRFLSGFLLTVNGASPEPLRSGATDAAASTFYTSTPVTGVDSPDLTVLRERYVSHGLHEEVTVFNHTAAEQLVNIAIEFDADFADLFEVRRHSFRKAGFCRSQIASDGNMQLIYERGEFRRETRIVFSQRPRTDGSRALFQFSLSPRDTWKVCISVLPIVDGEPEPLCCFDEYLATLAGASDGISAARALSPQQSGNDGPLANPPSVQSSHADLWVAYDRAIADLRSLTIDGVGGVPILAAGMPWFMAIFGRDSIISAIQTKLAAPDLMAGTLETLACYQATEANEFRQSEPGKIPHEIREGELSVFAEVPHSRYYGTVDATPLFLVLLAEAHEWIGDEALIRRLLPAAEAALGWIDEYGDVDGDGFVEYSGRAGETLKNQCWKDSDDSISFADGRLAEGPIAVAEVQGYVYRAKLGMSAVFATIGQEEHSRKLLDEADELKRRFNEAFWIPEAGYYALALDGKKDRVDAIASNAGQCLWTGIIDAERAGAVAERLTAPDMFSGWGVRTLSTEMARYHPVSYHNGSVWPHDNSIIAAGLAHYGFYRESEKIIGGLLDATSAMPDHRPPELFAGYPRGTTPFPVPYPTANAPQAWAAGAIVYGLETLLRIRSEKGVLVSDMPEISRPLSMTGIRYRGENWAF